MVSLGGFGGTSRGFIDASNDLAIGDINTAKADELKYSQMGAEAFGRALMMAGMAPGGPPPGMMPGPPGGPMPPPQPPMPGEPSVPGSGAGGVSGGSAFSNLPGWAPGERPMEPSGPVLPAPGGPPPAPAGGPPPGPMGPGGVPPGFSGFDLQTVGRRIVQANPGIEKNPRVLMAALERAQPLLNMQAKQEMAALALEIKGAQIESRERIAEANIKSRESIATQNNAARLERLGMSLDSRQSIAQLKADVQDRIRASIETGKALDRESREAIATLNSETRKEITDKIEAAKTQRAADADTAKGERLDKTLTSREGIAARKEEGLMARAEMTDSTKRELATLKAETIREIEAAKTGRAEISAAAKRDVAMLSAEARKEVATYLEEGRNTRAQAAEAGKDQRLATTEQGKDRRTTQTEEGKNQRFTESEDRKNKQFQATYDRLTKNADTRFKQAADKLEFSISRAKTIEERMALGQQLRLLEDQAKAAHNAVVEQTQAAFVPNAKLKKDLVDQAITARDAALARIESFRSQIRGGAAPVSPSPPASSGAVAPTTAAPPASMLKEGHVTTFQNGQKWTLEGGQPKRVP